MQAAVIGCKEENGFIWILSLQKEPQEDPRKFGLERGRTLGCQTTALKPLGT